MDRNTSIIPLSYKSSSGFNKKWIFSQRFSMVCDVFQKIGWTVTDLNKEICNLENAHPKDILYVIFLVDWIASAVRKLREIIPPPILGDFSFIRESELRASSKFLKALRSFAGAHPLDTDKHPEFGFDGSKLCVDIRPSIGAIELNHSNRCYSLSIDGLTRGPQNRKGDYYLFVYSEEDNYEGYYTIACNFRDLYDTAQLYLDKLYALDVYLSKQKRAEWKGKI